MSKRRNSRRRRSSFVQGPIFKVGAGVGVLAIILGALFGTGFISTNSSCKEAGFAGAASIDTCKADTDYVYDNIAIVVGNTANSPAPQLNEDFANYIKNSLLSDPQTEITIFSATPTHPKITYDRVELKTDGNTDDLLKNIDQQVNNINTAIQTEPKENGAEYLETIQRAARTIQNRKDDSIVLVIGSGLSDTAPLNFASNQLLQLTSQELVAAFNQANLLNGGVNHTEVVWYGLGDTAAPQKSLSEKDIDILKEHYATLLDQFNLTLSFTSGSLAGDSVATKHTVKPTALQAATLSFQSSFDDTSSLGFISGTPKLREGEQKAWEAIVVSGIPAKANANPNITIQVDGYVATYCNKAPDITLAQQRADTIKKLLQAHGINNQIIATGRGETNTAKQNQICIGKSPESELQKQRIVIISGKE